MTNTRVDYLAAINRAIDHIVRNVDQPLRLQDVAGVAGFSPFHFHRVFGLVVGEKIAPFVKRVRLERALAMIANAKPQSLTEVAIACGFASSSDFSRAFKQRYGVPPSAFDLGTFKAQRRQELIDAMAEPLGRHALQRLPIGENPDRFAVVMRDLPARHVAYLRVLQPYRGGVAEGAARMIAWAESRGFADGQWLGYSWDDPDLVALDDCRYDIGLELPQAIAPEGEISYVRLPAMRVASLAIEGAIDLEQRALDWLYGTWLPASGLVPDEQPCFEVWRGRPFASGGNWFALALHIAVR